MRRFLAVGCCLATLGSVAPAAHAATRWSRPEVIAAGAGLSIPVPVTDTADGTALVLVGRGRFRHPETGRQDVAVRPPGGPFAPASTVSGPYEGGSGIIANFAGDAGLVTGTAGGGVRFRLRAPGAAFGEPAWLVEPHGGQLGDGIPQQAVLGDDGTVTVAIQHAQAPLEVVARRPDGTRSVRSVPGSTGVWVAGLTVSPGGAAAVVWRDTATDDIRSSAAAPGQPFEEPTVIAKASYSTVDNLALVQDRRGDALVAWTGGAKPESKLDYGSVHTSYRPASGDWGQPKTIPGDPVPQANHLDLAMNPRGDAAIAWMGWGFVAMSHRPAGGDWEQAVNAPENDGPRTDDSIVTNDPTVGIGANGDATVVYQAGGDHPFCLEAMDRPAGGRFGTAEPVLDRDWWDAAAPRLAVGPDGEAVVVWGGRREKEDPGVIWSAAHQISPAPTVPSVTCLGTSSASLRSAAANPPTPPALVYRLTRAAKVEVRVRRVAGDRRPRVGIFRAKGRPGSNRTTLPAKLRDRLKSGRTYAAQVTAIGRSGKRSRSRVVRFAP